MHTSVAVHLIGIVFWIGSLIVITRFFNLASDSAVAGSAAYRNLMSRAYFGFSVGGLVLATVTGIYQLSSQGMSYYMKQGWFHGKLTLVLVLVGITVAVGIQIKKLQIGAPVTRKTAGMLHGITSLSFILIILLTILGR